MAQTNNSTFHLSFEFCLSFFMRIPLLISFIILLSLYPDAQTRGGRMEGRVVKILDGDTYDLLVSDEQVFRIRMNGIDAPEKGQAYGQKAKEYLGQLCFKQTIRVQWYSKDRNGRYIADSYLPDGRSLSLEMIRAGYAWHFKKYSGDTILSNAEIKARQQHIGLWVDTKPETPWDYRLKRKRY
jgi:endonuclease YncB( thermonuclease family)